MRETRSLPTPILARELCRELRALVGSSGNCVLLQTLQSRLGAGWGQLDEAVRLATSMGWIEGRGPYSVALLPQGMKETAPTDVPTKPSTPEFGRYDEWPTALSSRRNLPRAKHVFPKS